MKLEELGLKTKPATKYFEHGYIKFFTENKSLGYKVYRVTKTNQALIEGGSIIRKEQLTKMLAAKSIKDVLEANQ